jgi:glycosyltransferase involved in cell wall biosynthesis
MIRYAVLTPSLAQPGGAERHIYALIAHADPARLRCAGVAVSGQGGVDPGLALAIRGHGIDIVGDPPRGRFFGPRPPGLVRAHCRTLQQAIREACRGAQVLVTWGSSAMARFTQGLGIPVVCVSHSSENGHQPVDGITHLVGVSRAATEFWGEAGRGLPVAIIPNGVEVEHCVPRKGRAWQRAAWGLTPGQVVVGYVGRHHPVKRPGACIRALAALPEDHVAVLVGNQPHRHDVPAPHLVDLARDLGVTHRVRFEPPRARMGDAYAAMDCLMLASAHEADSLTLKEAMICGLPACATRVGSVPEMEEEFGDRCVVEPIVDPDSAEHLAACVRLAVSCVGLRRADWMRRHAWDRWTAPAMAERWADYLEGVVAGRG